jgi:hypothetical protein
MTNCSSNLGNFVMGGDRWEINGPITAFNITDGDNTATPTVMVTSQIPANTVTSAFVGLPVNIPSRYPTGTTIASMTSGSITVTLPAGGTAVQGTASVGTVGRTAFAHLKHPHGHIDLSLRDIGADPGGHTNANTTFASMVYLESTTNGFNETARIRLDNIYQNGIVSVLDGATASMTTVDVQNYYGTVAIGANESTNGTWDQFVETIKLGAATIGGMTVGGVALTTAGVLVVATVL